MLILDTCGQVLPCLRLLGVILKSELMYFSSSKEMFFMSLDVLHRERNNQLVPPPTARRRRLARGFAAPPSRI